MFPKRTGQGLGDSLIPHPRSPTTSVSKDVETSAVQETKAGIEFNTKDRNKTSIINYIYRSSLKHMATTTPLNNVKWSQPNRYQGDGQLDTLRLTSLARILPVRNTGTN
ncbi:hypothetical protein L798_10682 [Zootermopsis nevadensis]|uniref:Uncharacterized protein n=1 Tax=Zootermopsis nevadensis TaxID=136037 RepID=A0A067QZN8_ZOONE|nr:hypothetical protein L798_10682 [Zootermopsis nevadensis]